MRPQKLPPEADCFEHIPKAPSLQKHSCAYCSPWLDCEVQSSPARVARICMNNKVCTECLYRQTDACIHRSINLCEPNKHK